MSIPAPLRGAKRIACKLCGVEDLTVETWKAHDDSKGHQSRVASYKLQRAIDKVVGWTCPGLP